MTISNSSYSSHAQGTYYTNDATCTYKGYDKYYCSRKGDGCTGQVSVARSSYDANYHYEYVGGPAYSTYTSVITAATCTATGTMGTYCSGCNKLKSTSSIPKIDHTTTTSYGNGYSSCTTDGFIRTYCSSCNTTISTSSYSSHAQGTYKSNDATCTYKGYNYYYCSRKSDGCTGETSAARSSYDTSYHYQSVGGTAWGTYSKVITAATCTATGTMGTYCSGCDAQRSTSTIAIDSSNHTDKLTSEGLATNCTTTGYISTYCYACNTTVSNARYSSHSYGDYYTTTAATCSSTGVQRANCTRSNCSGYKTATIAKDSSNHSNVTTQSGLTTDCTTTGYIKRICTDCDAEISSSRYTSHSYGYWKTTTAATCTTSGTKRYYCNRTGCTSYNSTQTIAALGHDFKYVSTSKHTCSRCSLTKAHVFLANGQGYQVCDLCGYNTGIMLNFAPTTNNNVCDGVDCGVSKYYQSETILTKKETAILNKDEDDLIIMD